MCLLATFTVWKTVWQIWDQAPPEWYLIYVICAFLGVVLIYILWKKWGGYHDSEDDKE